MTSATAPAGAPRRSGLAHHYEAKAERYFAGARHDFIAELPVNPMAHILEVGCGSGDTGALALSGGRAGTYVGVDINRRAAEKARGVLSEVHVGDIERMELAWPAASFDAVILSEVLEHLLDPWAVVARLVVVVLSTPFRAGHGPMVVGQHGRQ